MIINGKRMIVKADGVAVAACKSCSLDIDVSEIEIASPSDGQWRHVIAGRKSWKVSTNHLVECLLSPDDRIVATATGSLIGLTTNAGVRTDSSEQGIFGSGLNFYHIVRDTSQVVYYNHYSLAESDSLASQIEKASGDSDMVAIVSCDDFGMNANLKETIETYLHVTLPSFQTGQQVYGAFAVIGKPSTSDPGVVAYNPDLASTVRAEMYLNEGEQSLQMPLKTLAQKAGQMFKLEISVNGFPYDVLTGNALCSSFHVVGTVNNLMQGSFSWTGTGPLE